MTIVFAVKRRRHEGWGFNPSVRASTCILKLLDLTAAALRQHRRSSSHGRSRDDKLVLTVGDTGIGIAEEDREVIFEKFRQSGSVLDNDGLTREHSGTGLGLSIVRELCKLLGGEISFESELGQGSMFKAVLPWNFTEKPRFSSELSDKLDELVRPDPAELRAKVARPVA